MSYFARQQAVFYHFVENIAVSSSLWFKSSVSLSAFDLKKL
jgi:hypothetical protein